MFGITLRKSLLILAALVVIWAPLQAWLLINQFSLDWWTAILDSEITATNFAFVGFAILNTLSFYQPDRKKIPFVLLATLLLAFASAVGSEYLIQLLTEGPWRYMENFHAQRVVFSILMALLMLSLAWLQSSRRNTTEEEQRKQAVDKLAREAELSSLRQQLQPHFLFNSLNSINALIGTQPEKARMMVQQLSDFLRGTVKKDDSQLVPLFEELQQLRLYLDIEKVRFGHRLATAIDNDNASLSAKLPPLLMQPVVENAIKFGLYDTVGETIIKVKTYIEGKQLVIEVENPFDATTAAPRQGTGFGLSSLQRRLYLLYARNDLLTTTQNENTFTTQIRIPQA
jgi:two-component system LytT family sensor kinase